MVCQQSATNETHKPVCTGCGGTNTEVVATKKEGVQWFLMCKCIDCTKSFDVPRDGHVSHLPSGVIEFKPSK